MLDFLCTLSIIFIFYTIITFAIICIRIMILAIKYRKWRKFAIPTIGVVGTPKDVNCIYGKKDRVIAFRYDYEFTIFYNNQEFDDVFSEECPPGVEPITHPGKQVNILWLENEGKYITANRFKAECKIIVKQTYTYTAYIWLRAMARKH